MDKIRSKIVYVASRLLKVLMAALVLPPLVIGLVSLLRNHLLIDTQLGRATFLDWVDRGFITYLGVHVLLYRPVTLFKACHRMFAVLAAWLFGGQVSSTTERPSSGGHHRKGKGSAAAAESGGAEGSTLVSFSPYAVPFAMILVCIAGWLVRRWVDSPWVNVLSAFFIGVAIAFHWTMTADDLQQQRKRWYVETYLLAIELVFVITVLVGAMCLPMVVPGFSFIQWLSDALLQTRVIYGAAFERLFGV